VRHALTTDVVRAAANTTGSGTNGGTDVTVTVMVTGTATESVPSNNNISTPTLDRGSVTVVGPSGFNLQLNGKLLTLKKGYRLKGFKITSGDPDADSNNQNQKQAAIKLAGVGTSLNNMNIDCRGLDDPGTSFAVAGLGDRCIEVTAETLDGTITLEGLEVEIQGNKNYTAAIVHNVRGTTLRVVGSTIRSTDTGGQGVVGVLGLGVLGSGGASAGPVIVQSSTVDLRSIRSGQSGQSGQGRAETIAVLLNVGGSKVLNSVIKLSGDNGHPKGSIGVKVNHSSSDPDPTVVVEGTTFETQNNGVGIGINKAGGGSLSLVNNNFPPFGDSGCGSGDPCLQCKFYDSSSNPPSCRF